MIRNAMKIMIVSAASAGAFAGAAEAAPATTPGADADVTRVVPDRAARLRAEAEQMYSQPREWRRAAQLLEQSAQLRDARDAEAYSCLLMAGRLYSAVADHRASRRSYEKAAEQALSRGAVLDAAHAYLDAAHAAANAKQPEAARALIERASLLAASPMLSAQQVEQINGRLVV
jgi:tetratricopeptide (TPR) repeat protein